METTTPLAARLKAARRKLRLTQKQAARRWRVNQRSLEAWEAGEHAPLPRREETDFNRPTCRLTQALA